MPSDIAPVIGLGHLCRRAHQGCYRGDTSKERSPRLSESHPVKTHKPWRDPKGSGSCMTYRLLFDENLSPERGDRSLRRAVPNPYPSEVRAFPRKRVVELARPAGGGLPVALWM
jgi:hypothetical protein